MTSGFSLVSVFPPHAGFFPELGFFPVSGFPASVGLFPTAGSPPVTGFFPDAGVAAATGSAPGGRWSLPTRSAPDSHFPAGATLPGCGQRQPTALGSSPGEGLFPGRVLPGCPGCGHLAGAAPGSPGREQKAAASAPGHQPCAALPPTAPTHQRPVSLHRAPGWAKPTGICPVMAQGLRLGTLMLSRGIEGRTLPVLAAAGFATAPRGCLLPCGVSRWDFRPLPAHCCLHGQGNTALQATPVPPGAWQCCGGAGVRVSWGAPGGVQGTGERCTSNFLAKQTQIQHVLFNQGINISVSVFSCTLSC